ncbi:DNA-protecting protein DprA [Candidatus Symbiopectobacterium sp. 'North America']|uniref:DNA-protecting protein DprA n=1 Tax=Candidatus Symbiopectobacterium sp. 'North America' TaxID=2794574 RepID=UPI0018C9235A|nr:DNA-protecting protein DprA [Candidatus Symbiopectobacterium sp. 'North America']MBG6245998.1 DNA-protecting protein DprA [Candidatus Symbiopectobacterium sp. 'North America']
MQDVELWLWLMNVCRLNAVKTVQLVEQLRPLAEVTAEALSALALSEEQVAQFLSQDETECERVLRWLEEPTHHLLTYADSRYPPLLRQITASPRALFVRGNPQLLCAPQLAMVGSRHPSAYGAQWGHCFAQELALNGFVITSGLALGIDGVAHQAALDAGGKSVAVLGNGLQQTYPRRHRALAELLVEQGGALVSEFPLNEPPKAINFPRRNRIINGMSLGVLIVEASMRSGSLVTARCALEQNRDLFVLPGALDNPMVQGTHWLIQQGAYLVTCPKDIIEQLGSGLSWLPLGENETISALDPDVELPFAGVLANVGDEVTPVDVVAERAYQPVPEVVGKLLDLELAGWIEAVPGGYVRLRRDGHVRRTHVLI